MFCNRSSLKRYLVKLQALKRNYLHAFLRISPKYLNNFVHELFLRTALWTKLLLAAKMLTYLKISTNMYIKNSWSAATGFSVSRKADIAKVIIAASYFWKNLHRRCLTVFSIYQVSECTSALNTPGFWIYHDSEYASGFKYAKVLNMPGLHRALNMPEYAWIIPEYVWLCLNRCLYAWICGNMR